MKIAHLEYMTMLTHKYMVCLSIAPMLEKKRLSNMHSNEMRQREKLNGTQFTKKKNVTPENKSLDALLRNAFLPFSASDSLSFSVICSAFYLTSTVNIEHNRRPYDLRLRL